jgi:hypothetical protein
MLIIISLMFEFWQWKEIFLSPQRPDQLWGHSPSYQMGVRWQECEADHFPQSTAGVKIA